VDSKGQQECSLRLSDEPNRQRASDDNDGEDDNYLERVRSARPANSPPLICRAGKAARANHLLKVWSCETFHSSPPVSGGGRSLGIDTLPPKRTKAAFVASQAKATPRPILPAGPSLLDATALGIEDATPGGNTAQAHRQEQQHSKDQPPKHASPPVHGGGTVKLHGQSQASVKGVCGP